LQLTHYNSNFKKHKFPITLVCDNVTNAANVGSLFRTADAFGIEKLIFCGTETPLGRKMSKTSRATEKFVDFEMHEDVEMVIEKLKAEECYIVGLEITNTSVALTHLNLQSKQHIVLVIGDENFGISETVLQQCDEIIHIDMYGENSSMNVVQAASIALYEITKQLQTS